MDKLFCGGSDIYPSVHFTPKSQPWSSEYLIGHLDKTDIKLQTDTIELLQPTFWDNLCSEYDAENFCLFLKKHDVRLSPEFKAFEFVWRRDEYNHYLGFKHIYSILYGISSEAIDFRLRQRLVDFTPIMPMLNDEFKICLLLAYDEIATTKSYSEDYDLYSSFGPKELLKWIKWVTRDEAYHFNNCMAIIGKNNYHRIAEISGLVDQFVEWDIARNEYTGTFVLDHNNYSVNFLLSCADIMKKYFSAK